MKKIVLLIAVTSSLGLFSCGPSTTNPSGTNPGNTPTTKPSAATGGDSLATKASFIAYLNCVKNSAYVGGDANAKSSIESTINILTTTPDSDWPNMKGAFTSTYETFSGSGCK